MAIYLDWNATSPRHSAVKRAMEEAETEAWANPSSVHQAGRQARKIQENAREVLARELRRSPRDVIFTAGGTEANHLALSGAKVIITSRIEHPSIVGQTEWLRTQGTQVIYVDVDPQGRVVVESVDRALRSVLGDPLSEPIVDRGHGSFNNGNTPLIALMAVNHETGVVQPLPEVHRLAQSFGARLHVDAVQWVGRGDPEFLLHADSLAVAAHKFRGPKGLGALVFDCGWTPTPLGRGGAQERGLRPGTVDAVALAGLIAALERLDESRSAYRRVAHLGDHLAQHLAQNSHAPVVIHGTDADRLRHVVNFRAEGWKGDELVAALDLAGICVSSGSACSAGTAEPSAVIEAMLGRQAAEGAVRISLGEETSIEEVAGLIDALTRQGILRDAPFLPPNVTE